jgi:hypothetical protein
MFKKKYFQISVTSVPEVISVMNRNFILDTQNKSNEGMHILFTVVNFA